MDNSLAETVDTHKYILTNMKFMILRPGKRGIIHKDLAPIQVDDWLRMVESLGDMFWRVVGKVDAIIKAAQAAGRKWFKGMAANRSIFGQE